MLSNQITTGFIARLRTNDQAAWFELWQTFGPVIRAQLAKWGQGRISPETARDLSQETMAALSGSIDRYDPARGARFSTWLLAIAKHVFGDEMDRRTALKRGGGKAKAELDETWMVADAAARADEAYEAAVFRAKVEAAIRRVERECEMMDFEVYRMRVFDGKSGKDVAESLGTSEPTVSRRLTRVREQLRQHIAGVVAQYSFTNDEMAEPARNGLRLSGSGGSGGSEFDPQAFDDALAEIYHRQVEFQRADHELVSRALR